MKMPDRIWGWITGASTNLFPDDAKTHALGIWTEEPVGGNENSHIKSTPAREHAETMLELLRDVIDAGDMEDVWEVQSDVKKLIAKIEAEHES